jgi:hypothetical protein
LKGFKGIGTYVGTYFDVVVNGPDVVGDFSVVRVVETGHPLNVVAQLVRKGPRVTNFQRGYVQMEVLGSIL